MTHRAAPRLASWLLKRLGYENEPLAGDLLEEFHDGRTAIWYWRQVMTTILMDVPQHMRTYRTAGLLALLLVGAFWLGSSLTAPGVNADALATLLARAQSEGGFARYNLFTGGNLSRVTIFALGIMPYLTVLTVGWVVGFMRSLPRHAPPPSAVGPDRILAWTRYAAMLLCAVQATAIALWLERQAASVGGLSLIGEPGGWGFRITLVLTLTATTGGLIWLSEQITTRGIGWGASLVFFAALVVGLPGAVTATLAQPEGAAGLQGLVSSVAAMSGLMWLVEPGRRRLYGLI